MQPSLTAPEAGATVRDELLARRHTDSLASALASALATALATAPTRMFHARIPPAARSSLRAVTLCACLHAPSRPLPSVDPAQATTRAAPRVALSQEVPPAQGFPLSWNPGQVLLQGYVGAKFLSEFTVTPGGSPPIELSQDEYDVLPVVGGGAQLKLAGKSLDFGIEGMLELSGRTNLEAFASSGGTSVAVFDVNLLVVEVYGGPFVSRFFGDSLRLYGGAGPLLQWVSYDQDDDSNVQQSTEGFGGGVYARGGFEFLLPSNKLVGLGARWSESNIDFNADFGEMDLTGLEVFFTYSYGLEPRSKYDWP